MAANVPPTTCAGSARRSLHQSASLASTASSGSSFSVRTRALWPVAASLISYGRSSKIRDRRTSKSTTLYVLRVARSGRDWYVARRYSEFRALHDALAAQFIARRACAACRELATFYGSVRFPQRFRLRSSLFSKRVIEAARMRELNQYLSFVIETTQGLLDANDDDDDEDDAAAGEVRHDGNECPAMALVRDFLMVDENEHLLHALPRAADLPCEPQPQNDAPPAAGRPRLQSKGSTVSSFRVRELDVLYKEKESRSASCADPLASAHNSDLSSSPVLDNVFEDFPAPPLDAIVQHQQSDGDLLLSARASLHPLRRAESLCHGRR
ncbi:hypothetical protein PybrP1_012292 [[Pythium] brassicae (nom. inval.)]|nr:hypothetical protein PybrP1_012292 [[Pythium] brassicae (nom. inval.)]